MITANGLTKRYGAKLALADVSFEVGAASGAGALTCPDLACAQLTYEPGAVISCGPVSWVWCRAWFRTAVRG